VAHRLLDAQDLHVLMERDPRIAERIREVARTRIKRELVTPKGDILTEEIEDTGQAEEP
jgi:voltage-gated potassium channel